jgi:serine/threonine-protein kinase
LGAGVELRPGIDVLSLCRAGALADRAASADRSKYPYFLFLRGLAEYRRGEFSRAIATLRGDASRVLGPAPYLVQAMALHQAGRSAEARPMLSLAVRARDWRATQVRDGNDWLIHALRREAERLMLPGLPDFLAGKYQPRDNDERFALLGVCQFTGHTLANARLYADAFAADPQAAKVVGFPHHYAAVRLAALVGLGHCKDGNNVDETERTRWRALARDWFAAELTAWNAKLEGGYAADRYQTWQTLMKWRADPEMAGLCKPAALASLPAAERDQWLALWKEVDALLARASTP